MSDTKNQRNHGPGPRLYQPGDRIPQGDQERKDAPMHRGLLGYFPAALFEVASHSLESDRKHNPGNTQGPTWARGKSSDHEDCIVRHLIDAGARSERTKDRKYHLTALAWRALALLQEECECEGATPGQSSVFPSTVEKLSLLVAERKRPRMPHPAQELAVQAFEREQGFLGAGFDQMKNVELGGAGE